MANEEFQEEDENSAILTGVLAGASTGAVAGATAGAAGGPIGAAGGAAIGAVIGGGLSLFASQSRNSAAKKAFNKAKRKRNEALARAAAFKDANLRQAASLRSTGKQLAPSKAKGPKTNTVPTGSTPTAAIGSGVSSSGTF